MGTNFMHELPVETDENGIPLGVRTRDMFTTVMPRVVVPTTLPEIRDKFNGFSGVDTTNGDFATVVSGLNGQTYIVLSSDPTKAGESRIEINEQVTQPERFESAFSYAGRGTQIFATASIYANDPVSGNPDTVPNPISIVSAYQSSADFGVAYNATAGTIVTLILNEPLPASGANNAVYIGDWVNITGFVDTRLNYQNFCIKFISSDRKTITGGYSDEGILPSLAIATVTPTLHSAKVEFYNNMGGARDGLGMRMTASTATSNAVVSVRGGGDNQISGVLNGDHRTTTASTAPVVMAGSALGSFEYRATGLYRLNHDTTMAYLSDTADNQNTSISVRAEPRTSSRPGQTNLKPRFRIYKPINISRPVVEIVSAVKTASATAIVTTRSPHGLVTGNYITAKGSRDVTNFPFMSAPVAVTVLSPTSLSFTWGSSATATSYGGAIVICNGSKDMSAQFFAPQAIQSFTTDNSGWVNVIGSATWTQAVIGDYVKLMGVGDATDGSPEVIEGQWQVALINGTTLTLMPIVTDNGTRISPVVPLNQTIINCGGFVVIQPTLRIHDYNITPLTNIFESARGQLSFRHAITTYSLGGSTTATQGTAGTISSTTGLGGWFVQPAIIGLPDIASAALTSSSTGSSISNALGNGFQVTIPVTAVTGTLPTLDVRIEESFDGGTNWVTLYEFERITAVGSYNSPILRASGRSIRYVRTVGGTTPSFTHALTRGILPFMPSEPQKRIMDRTISLTTINSTTPRLFVGAANNIMLAVNIGAATTAPVIQLEGSEDGTNFYSIGSPLTAVANSTVYMIVNQSHTYARARVSTIGVTVTPGYVCIKAYS